MKNFFDYTQLAVRTDKDPRFILSDLNGTKIRLVHACLGMTSEAGELFFALTSNDKENIKEEIGDICWYVALAKDSITSINNIELTDLSELQDEVFIFTLISECADIVKKWFIYNKAPDLFIFDSKLGAIVSALSRIAGDFNLTIEECLEHNIDKLKKRYPDSYSDDHAIARADKADFEKLSRILLDSVFGENMPYPEDLDEMENRLSDIPDKPHFFPSDLSDVIKSILGFDPSESPMIEFRGNSNDAEHGIG